jgi:hypothetical protein
MVKRAEPMKKLPSGTKPTGIKKELSLSQLCAILRACRKSRVAELQFGDLYVRFVRTDDFEAIEADRTSPPAKALAESIKKVSEDKLDTDELDLKDGQLTQMLIENPALAEELMEKGEFELDG